MKIEGTYRVRATRHAVWQKLMDPAVLARSMPGCEKLEPNPDGSYHTELKIGIAAVKGTYHGRIELLDVVPPERFKLKVSGQGTGGFVTGEGVLTLSETGEETSIHYSGEAQVGGVIAAVGQRLILGATRQLVQHFFQSLSSEVLASSSSPATP